MASQVLIEVIRNVANPFDVHASALEFAGEFDRQGKRGAFLHRSERGHDRPDRSPSPMLLPPAPAPGLESNTLRQLNTWGLESVRRGRAGSRLESSPPCDRLGDNRRSLPPPLDEGKIAELRARP